MIRKALILIGFTGIALALAGWLLSAPQRLEDSAFAGLTGDATRGARLFHAGGCAGCHAAADAEGAARLILSGGGPIHSPFGTFYAPNISPAPEGIGGWSLADFGNAMLSGVSPEGRHYYPAFPYTSYGRLTPQDMADLKLFLDGLPPSDRVAPDHDLPFPFTIRRGLGLWKRAYATPGWVRPEAPEPGRRLVEALGHCGECHTPRGPLGGLQTDRWLAGAPNPAGKGRIPNITPAALDWSRDDLIYYLQSGLTPGYDSAGGEMAEVIANLSQLAPEDRAAIADYLLTLPPVATAGTGE